MANLFVMLVNHDLEKHGLPKELPEHLLDKGTRRSLTAEKRVLLHVWNVAHAAESTLPPSMIGNASLCVRFRGVPELCRAAYILYAAPELGPQVENLEGLAQAHGRDLANAVHKCAEVMDKNFETCRDALHRACTENNWI